MDDSAPVGIQSESGGDDDDGTGRVGMDGCQNVIFGARRLLVRGSECVYALVGL